MSPIFAPDRAVAKALREGQTATALKAALVASGVNSANGWSGAQLPIHRASPGFIPRFWPYVRVQKIPSGTRTHAGRPRLVRDIFRVTGCVRSDKTSDTATLLEPIAQAITDDLIALLCTPNEGGKTLKSHILDPRFEFQEPLQGTTQGANAAPVLIHYLGCEAVFLTT